MFPVPLVIAAVATLLGIGGIAYGADQSSQREEEAARFRATVRDLEQKLSEKERELERARSSVAKNQVLMHALVAEIEELRRQLLVYKMIG